MQSKKDPEAVLELRSLLDYVNSAKVTKRDFIRVMDECDRRSQEPKWQNGDGMIVIALMFGKKNPQKSQAVFFRFLALNRLLESGAIPGYYAMPKNAEGAIPIREAVLEAAATEPLIQENDQAVFERESFVRRCLAKVEMKTKKVQ